MWITYRDRASEFPNIDFDVAQLRVQIADSACFVLVDPTTQTLAVASAPGDRGHIERIFTLTSATVAARTAVDRMMEVICQGAITLGLTLLWGDYIFPATFTLASVETTRPLRYFNTLVPPGTKTKATLADGRVSVRYECAPAPLLSFLLARTP